MTTSKPTTGEIVRELHCRSVSVYLNACNYDCEKCEFQEVYPGDNPYLDAIDRLESQERKLARNADELSSISEQLKAMTARAEQAEKERDAAVAVIGIQAEKLKESHVVLCNICEFEDMIGCVHKNHCDGYQLFKWRGQPQEGEGK